MPQRLPYANGVLSWAVDLDEKTGVQAGECSHLPFIEGHIALMPDAHFGYGSTVGSVIPTRGAIIPSAVGVDIGCGMIAQQLTLTSNQLPDNLDRLHSMLANVIPSGVGKGHEGGDIAGLWARLRWPRTDLTDNQKQTAAKQFGTLGSGNHFVEVCLDERDNVWLVLHSGSRGIGNQLANIHIDKAKGMAKAWFIDLPNADLAYLPEGVPEFDHYLADLMWAQAYAMGNRQVMMEAAVNAVEDFLSVGFITDAAPINCHHNYTAREHHHGKNVWITRKGAIKAASGDLGVIPGSMGTRSYIVRGLGNPASYNSCSHGAGRRMSRAKAKRELTVESLEQAMVGKTWNPNHEALLDEHPAAYKDIDQVMEAQRDLVEVVAELHQILNYKGT